MTKPCKDCVAEGVTTKRVPALDKDGRQVPGNRCVTHHRKRKKALSARAHELRTQATYGLTSEDYWRLYDSQGGVCFICGRAKGISKRLCVDHDHHLCDDHPPEMGCPRCVRCLLCSWCNEVIGRIGVEALYRAIEVLTDPPAQKVLVATTTSCASQSCYGDGEEVSER